MKTMGRYRTATFAHQAKLFGTCAVAALIVSCCASAANAATCTTISTECSADLNIISMPNIGSGSQGTVTLTELTVNSVLVEVSLTKGDQFVNTGGPHTPFTFNLSSALQGVTVAIDTTPPDKSGTLPQPFSVGPSGQQNTPYGTFTNSIDVAGGNGSGPGVGNYGPLFFTVTDTNSTSSDPFNLLDFVTSTSCDSKGKNCDPTTYLFAADILGTGGNTGAVAADSLACVAGTTGCGTTGGGHQGEAPLPATLPLFASGLGLVGWFSRRRRRQAAA